MFRLCLVLPIILLLSGHAAAAPVPDTRHEVKLTVQPHLGLVTVEQRSLKNVGILRYFDDKGLLVSQRKCVDIKDLEFAQTIIDLEDDQVTRFTRKYTRANFVDEKMKWQASYIGRVLTFERKGGRYVLRPGDGPALSEEETIELEREANEEGLARLHQVLEPGKKVRLGDSWVPDPSKLAGAMNLTPNTAFDAEKVKATVKLARVDRKDRHQWVTLEVSINLPVKTLDRGTVLPGSALTSRGTVEVVLGHALGGRTRVEGKYRVRARVEAEGAVFRFEGESQFEGERSTTIKTKE